MQFRLTAHYVDLDGKGFSESYWLQAADYANAETIVAPLLTARLGMLLSSVHQVYAEVSNVDSVRDSRVVGSTGPTSNPGTYTPAAGTVPLPTEVALLVSFEADPSHKNRKFIHGMTTADVDGNRFIPSAGFTTAFQAYQLALVTNAFQVRSRFGPNPTPPPASLYLYHTIVLTSPIRVTTRKIGRPFGLSVGRRRVA